MRRDRLFGTGLMHLAVYVLMVVLCAGSVWGLGLAPVNPAFRQWQKERVQREAKRIARTNAVARAKGIRSVSGAEGDGEFGLAPEIFDTSYLANLNTGMDQGIQDGFASRYDLRERGVLTAIRDQGNYGTCWAHGTFSSLESCLLVEGEGAYDFSENNLANLHGFDLGFDEGGNATMASAYLLRWSGPALESEDPYPNPGGSVELPPTRHVQNIRWIPGRTSYRDNDGIKAAVVAYGALQVSYYHASSYYNSRTASYYFNGNQSRRSNHSVAIVGWDDNYPSNKFANVQTPDRSGSESGTPVDPDDPPAYDGPLPPGNGAFIVRNSWGEDWGDGGYFYVSYYDESFAWKTLHAYVNSEVSVNYDAVYQYDPLGMVSSYGYGGNTAWGASIFTATEATQLAAVGFYALVPNTSYTIYVYVGCTAGAPTSGTLAATQGGKTDSAGFFTVPLNTKASLSARQRFSVVLKLTTPGYTYPLACEYAYSGYSSDATASSGQTFLSSNGSSWTDFTQAEGSANFCCKAYVKAVAPVVPTLSSIAISGVSSLSSGQSATFTCEATYLGGSKKVVTPTWSIAEGRDYATVSPAGLVTAKSVTEQQRATVRASYTEDGVTREATWGFYVTIAAPSAPTGVAATQGTETSCIRVSWTAPSGATEYAVYRATANNSNNAQYLDKVTVARYNDTSAVPGVDYWYFIKAKNSSGTSGYGVGANGWRKLSPPESVAASDTLLDKVAIEWSDVEGAKYYRVYRAESMEGAKSALGGWQSATTFRDTTATAGVMYYYFVVAAVDANGSRPSDYSIGEDGMRAVPVTIDHLEIRGDANIAAGDYADYVADAVYTDRHRAENITPGSWSIVGDGASVVNGRVTAAMVPENKTVVLVATCTEDGRTARGEKQITITVVKPVAPRNVSAAVSLAGVTLTWSVVSGAASYRVYRSSGEGAVEAQIGSTSSVRFTDSSAIPGVAYTYSVSAANGAGEGPQSGKVSATIPLAAPTGVAATSNRTDGVLVSWSAVNGATHYRVARATAADGAKTELGSWQAGTSYNDTSAMAGTTYFYFVRAATGSDGANASGYSADAQGVRKAARALSSIAISGPDKVAASGSAVYSCTATYSDGSAEAVTPIWGANGSGAIDANGRLTALAVTEDSTVTVAASFGGKITTKPVRVIAPVAASATVSNVSVKPRWPFSSLLDIDYTLATTPEGTVALITLSGQDNDHNLPLAARTLTGDGAAGAVAAGSRRITWDIGADYPGFHAKSFDVNLEAVPYVIGVPSGVTASQGTSTWGVDLSWNAVEDATGYEVWRAKGSMDSSTATLVTNVENVVTYEDTSVDPGDIYFYWLKAVTQYGTGDFSGAVFGYRARVTVTVTFDGNGGTPSSASMSGVAGNAYGTLPAATRAGYDFTGWFTAASGGTQVTASSPFDENVTMLYAHWNERDKVQLWEDGPYWATTNIGAENPEDYGYYFWWGDTVGYKRENNAWVASDGSSSNFSFSSNNIPTYNKSIAALQSEGWITVDNVLAPEHDAAHVQWGGDWYMPTYQELTNLNSKCDWTWTTTNGVNGYVVRGRGDYSSASIFLPASGLGFSTSLITVGTDGCYWSSVPHASLYFSWRLYFDSSAHGANNYTSNYSRYLGHSVRPVQVKRVTVTLDRQGGTGGTALVTATYGSAMPVITVPTRAGYTFGGYWTATNGIGMMYYDGTGTSARTWDKTAAMTLYAKWIPGENLPTGGTLHVDAATGNDANDGRSWATAKATIQNAIDASSAGDLILVNDGRYEPISTGNKRIEIRSVNGATNTVIDASLQWSRGVTNRCATLGSYYDYFNSTLTGFCLTNGIADWGGGSEYGILNNCVLGGNRAFESGGGAECGILNNCLIVGNSAEGYNGGGGSYYATLNNCILQGNSAKRGGGSLLGTLNNCTISGNNATVSGGGAYEGILNNCIIWGNQAPTCADSDSVDAMHSCSGNKLRGVGNIQADPLFVDAAKGDFRLQSGSPCIDAGWRPWTNDLGADLAGNPRWQGVQIDMGAYESVGTAYSPAIREATTYYVDATSGNDANDGQAWTTAKSTIQSAIEISRDGDTILVAPGVYGPVATMDMRVRIVASDGMGTTTIDGGDNARCATLGRNEQPQLFSTEYVTQKSVLENFILKNGRAYEGGGAYGGILKNCVVTESAAVRGGGVYGTLMHNCTLSGNMASSGGGSWGGMLNQCIVRDNSSTGRGGGSLNGTLNNCLLYRNTAGEEGGGSDGATLNNCTVYGNTAGRYGGGSNYGQINNCIVWGNSASTSNAVYHNPTCRYSCLDEAVSGEGNIVADPLFVDAVNGDFRLQSGSPCIDAGSNAYANGDTDLAGNPRIANGTVDMGAYEFNPVAIPLPDGNYTQTVDGVEWSFAIVDGEATIVKSGYWKSAIPSTTTGPLTIPTVLGGCPVTAIGDYAFYNCSGLTAVSMPETITKIGDNAFLNCSGISSLQIPAATTSLQESAFFLCTNLVSIVVVAGNQAYRSIDGVLFSANGESLITCPAGRSGTYVIPEGTKSMGWEPFYWCASLTEVTIPASMTSVGLYPFQHCISLESIHVAAGNTRYCDVDGVLFSVSGGRIDTLLVCPNGRQGAYSIPEGTKSLAGFTSFAYCAKLTSIEIPTSVTHTGAYAFEGCSSLISVFVPDSVTNMSYGAFFECTSLESVRLPDHLTSINSFFEYCYSLREVNIPSSVTELGQGEFALCRSLESIVIPEGVVTIGNNATFMGCHSLRTIRLPASLQTIENGTFSDCNIDLVYLSPDSTLTVDDLVAGGISASARIVRLRPTHEGLPTDGDLYVDAVYGDDANDGCSWTTAKASIQAAIDSSSAGDLILVNDGRYEPIATDNKNIEIRSVNGAETTIIDASLQWSRGITNRCARLRFSFGVFTPYTTLSGFCLTNGIAPINDGSAGNATARYGGGVIGGILNNCIIGGNSAYGGGGACESLLNNCKLIGNSATYGGGASSSTLNNCVLAGNSATYGGGSEGITAVLNNCTLSGNVATSYGGGAADGRLNNCIVWGNSAPDSPDAKYAYGIHTCSGSRLTGVGNITSDPLFVDATNGNFRLQASSPCINAGWCHRFDSNETDLAGNSRWQGEHIDMGAYEFVGIIHSATNRGAATLYVNAVVGNDNNAGTSMSLAKKSVQSAIEVAQDGDTILVAPGTYSPVAPRDLKIRIASTEGAAYTVIDGEEQTRCATFDTTTNTVLVGFTLQNGRGVNGGGSSYGTLYDCILQNNASERTGGGSYYGNLHNCVLKGNTASRSAGGSWNGVMDNCLLIGNKASSGGGSMYTTLLNCTISGNVATYEGGGAEFATLYNCIVWGNTAQTSNAVYGSYCRFSCLDQTVTGTGNIVANPLFADATNGDYRLRTGSPCIDAGSNAYATGDTDLAGNPRIVNGTVDMGAYEGGVTGYDVTFDQQGGSSSLQLATATGLRSTGPVRAATPGRPFRTRATTTSRGTSVSIRATTTRTATTVATGRLFVLSKGSPNSERM